MNNNVIAIDIGSTNTGIYQAGHNIVLFEPSLVAFSTDNTSIIKEVGTEAKKLDFGMGPAKPVSEAFIYDGIIVW